VIAAEQAGARKGQGAPVPVARVIARLKSAAQPPRARDVADRVYRTHPEEKGVQMRRKGGRVQLEFQNDLSDTALRKALEQFIRERAAGKA